MQLYRRAQRDPQLLHNVRDRCALNNDVNNMFNCAVVEFNRSRLEALKPPIQQALAPLPMAAGPQRLRQHSVHRCLGRTLPAKSFFVRFKCSTESICRILVVSGLV